MTSFTTSGNIKDMTIEELQKRKKEAGLTNEEIARLANIPASTVAKVMSGNTRNPRLGTIQAIEAVISRAGRASGQKDDPGKDGEERYNKEKDNRQGGELPVNDPKESRNVRNTYSQYAMPSAGTTTQGMVCEPVYSVYQYGTSLRKAAAAGTDKGRRHYTVADYLSLPDDRRVELIDGRFYDMASPSGIHQQIILFLARELMNCADQHNSTCQVQISPFDVQLDGDDYTIVQPDLMVFCTHPELAMAERAIGVPDYVCEVASPSTAFYDATIKLFKYREAGVREVWLVDPLKEIIQVYLFTNGTMDTENYTFAGKVPVAISDGQCQIDFSAIRDRLKRTPKS